MEIICITKDEFLAVMEENNKKIQSLISNKKETKEKVKEFLTTREACELFNTSRQNLYNKRLEGVIKQYRFGNKKYYKYEEIRSIIIKSN